MGRAGISSAEQKAEVDFLDAVQGGILKGHGRGWQRLLFFRFTKDAAGSRNFLRQLVRLKVAPDKPWHWVTSALEQRAQRQGWHGAFEGGTLKTTKSLQNLSQKLALLENKESASSPFEIFGSILLTRAGLQHLKVPLTGPLASDAFTLGMKTRMSHAGPNEMREAPYSWEGDAARACHFVFLLACDDPPDTDGKQARFAHYEEQLRGWCSKYGAQLCGSKEPIQRAFAWREESESKGPYDTGYFPPREPFGFVDGISQPRFFDSDRSVRAARVGAPVAHYWTNLQLNQVLIDDDRAHKGGTFVSLLKIEQNVEAFRAYEHEVFKWLRGRFSNELTDDQAAYLAPALLMGRTRHGYPLGEVLGRLAATEPGLWKTLLQDEADAQREGEPGRPPQPPEWLNEFDFNQPPGTAHTGSLPGTGGCPFHVHARKMNPREKSNPGHGDEPKFIAAQPVRRGAVFGSEETLRACELRDRQRKPADPPVDGWPRSGTGLLFLAYMRDLAGQFELLHSHWARWTYFPANKSGLDPVLVHPAKHPEASPQFGGQNLPDPTDPSPLLRRLGGLYLYAPSIPWLMRGGK